MSKTFAYKKIDDNTVEVTETEVKKFLVKKTDFEALQAKKEAEKAEAQKALDLLSK